MTSDRHALESSAHDTPCLPKKTGWLRYLLCATLALTICGLVIAVYVMEKIGVPPRLLAPYIEKRTSGHNPTIVGTGILVAGIMRTNDRGQQVLPHQESFRLGAQPTLIAQRPAPQNEVKILVTSPAEATAAIAHANPGDVITFAPGTYRFSGSYLGVSRAGTALRPIIVRAIQPGSVTLEFDMVEGFKVTAPFWEFENLRIVGVCDSHYHCEHAFHVVGKGDHFVARNNTITDFNSHFKINADGDTAPDDGLIEGNTLTNGSVRNTDNPVNVIDIVVASRWVIRKNLITDFFKGAGNRTSYGGFAKGGGSQNLFENNLVICEYRLRSPGAISVGLSLGGGGTGAEYCRDKRCVTEQENSTVQGNLVAACSDDGIYLNKAAMSKVIHNTLIDTGGISVRFPSTSADIEGNLVDGKIRVRDNAVLREKDNLDTSLVRLFLGSHPVRDLFAETGRIDLRGPVPRRHGPVVNAPKDLCAPLPGNAAPASGNVGPPYGAFSDFAACRRR